MNVRLDVPGLTSIKCPIVVNARTLGATKNHHPTMKQVFATLCFSMLLFSCNHLMDRNKSLLIDPSIKDLVNQNVTKYQEALQPDSGKIIYSNKYMASLYMNDTLVKSTYYSSTHDAFKSEYFWNNDTLIIKSAFGVFSDIGFDLKIYKDTAIVTGIINNNLSYKNNITDSILSRITIPTFESKVVLAETPDSTKDHLIYGYAEFKESSVFLKENNNYRKERIDMKVYFISIKQNK